MKPWPLYTDSPWLLENEEIMVSGLIPQGPGVTVLEIYQFYYFFKTAYFGLIPLSPSLCNKGEEPEKKNLHLIFLV